MLCIRYVVGQYDKIISNLFLFCFVCEFYVLIEFADCCTKIVERISSNIPCKCRLFESLYRLPMPVFCCYSMYVYQCALDLTKYSITIQDKNKIRTKCYQLLFIAISQLILGNTCGFSECFWLEPTFTIAFLQFVICVVGVVIVYFRSNFT